MCRRDGIARLSRNVVMERNVNIGASSGAGGGVLVMPIANATTVPTASPANGGVLYVEGGAQVARLWRDGYRSAAPGLTRTYGSTM